MVKKIRNNIAVNEFKDVEFIIEQNDLNQFVGSTKNHNDLQTKNGQQYYSHNPNIVLNYNAKSPMYNNYEYIDTNNIVQQPINMNRDNFTNQNQIVQNDIYTNTVVTSSNNHKSIAVDTPLRLATGRGTQFVDSFEKHTINTDNLHRQTAVDWKNTQLKSKQNKKKKHWSVTFVIATVIVVAIFLIALMIGISKNVDRKIELEDSRFVATSALSQDQYCIKIGISHSLNMSTKSLYRYFFE